MNFTILRCWQGRKWHLVLIFSYFASAITNENCIPVCCPWVYLTCQERNWLFRLWGRTTGPWMGMEDARWQPVALQPCSGCVWWAWGWGESVIWLHRGLIALHLSNLISCRHLPAPELLFCIPNPSDLKQRTPFYFAGLLHHLNWSLKCLKHFLTNFLC